MGWSEYAPSLPSGSSWGTEEHTRSRGNNYTADTYVSSARGVDSTYYIKVRTVWTIGTNDYYRIHNYHLWVGGNDHIYYLNPSIASLPYGSTTVYRYYTGTGTGTATVGVSVTNQTDTTGNYSSAAKVSVSLPSVYLYTISYNGNGADSGSVASQTKTKNVALTLRANGYVRDKYVFVEWNTNSGGTGTGYAAGASYTANAAATLYAIWKKANIPVFGNDSGTIRQVERAYANIGGVIKEVTVFTNVGGEIKELV